MMVLRLLRCGVSSFLSLHTERGPLTLIAETYNKRKLTLPMFLLIDSAYTFKNYSYQAFDQHLNMILGEVEETVTTTEIDEETDEEIVKKQTRKVGMLFVRGDIVVLVSPPLRAG